MVQVDIFWSFAVGAGFAARSVGLLEKEEKPLESKPFLKTLLWLSVFFVPSGATLLWMYPDWETMQAGTWATVPGWLVALFSMTNVTQGILGFWVGWWLIRKGKIYEANLLWVAAYFGMFFVLVHGWDGSGYDRFLYSPMAWGGEVTPWKAGTFEISQFFTFWISPVAVTLYIMGAIMFPFFFRWMMQLEKESYQVAMENDSRIYEGQTRRRNYIKIVTVYGFGSAVACSLCIRLVGPVLGTLVFAGLMYWFALRKGAGLYLEFFKASTLQDPLPEPGGHGGAVQEGST